MTKFNFSCLFAFLLCATMVQGQGTFFSEDFGGGLPSDWMAVEVEGNGEAGSNWIYTTTGATGGTAGATPPIVSSTANNGWMIFDSDLNCSFQAQDAYLISPSINGADKDVVFLEFQSMYASFLDIISVQVTTDLDLPYEDWSEFLIYPNIQANDIGGDVNPDLISINISEAAAGQSTFYIAFRFLSDSSTGGAQGGCAYSWQIDDIVVTDSDPRPANDLMVNPFYAVPPNYSTPASQIESFGFIADVENSGSSTQTGANLNVSIMDESGSNVFSADLTYPAFGIDQLIENTFFPETFIPTAESGFYFGNYTLTIDGQTDDIPGNNVQPFQFEVSDTLFSKGVLAEDPSATRPSADESYGWGNVYYVPNGAGYYARYMSFGYANPSDAAGEIVTTYFLKWDGDTNGDGMANRSEYENNDVFFNSYTFTGNEADDQIITLPVDLDGNTVPLEDDTYYIVVAAFETDVATELFQLATNEIDYAAMSFMTDSLEMPRYAGALDVGLTDDYSLLGFGYDIQPYVTLSVSDDPNISTSVVLLNEANKIELAPNPVSDELRLNINLVKMADQVEIEIYDVAGRSLMKEQYSKVSTQAMTYNVKNWENGTYFVRVRTDEGLRTLRFVVQ